MMWSVSLLMKNARRTLSGRYLSALLCSFLYLFLAFCGLFLAKSINGKFLFVNLFLFFVGFFFYLGCLCVGLKRFFQEFRVGAPPVSTLLSPLQAFTFIRIFLILLWKYIIILLFSLFLVLPGIWKAYELKMVPYLLAENPHLTKKRAFTLSKEMTRKEKGRLFLMELPFLLVWAVSIAWLGFFSFPVILFTFPFYCAAQAEAYALLRAKAFAYEWTDENELSGFFRYPLAEQDS